MKPSTADPWIRRMWRRRGAVAYSLAERVTILLTRGIGLGLLALLTGAHTTGVYSLALSVAIVATLAHAGLEVALNGAVSGAPETARQQLRYGLLITGIYSAVLLAIALVAAPLLPKTLLELPSIRLNIWALAVALSIEVTMRGVCMGLGPAGYRAKSWSTTLSGIAFVSALLVLNQFGLSATSALRAHIGASLLSSMLLAGWLNSRLRLVPKTPGEGRLGLRPLRGMAATALAASTYRGSLYLSGRLDLLVIGFLLPAGRVGAYAVALSAVDAVTSLPKGLADVVLSRASSYVKGDGRRNDWRMYPLVGVFSIAALAVGATAMWFIGVNVLPDGFEGLGLLGLLLSAGALSMTLGRLMSYHLIALGDARRPVAANVTSLAIMLVLDLALVPTFGVYGAAAANSLSSLLLLPLLLPALATRVGTPWAAFIDPRRISSELSA